MVPSPSGVAAAMARNHQQTLAGLARHRAGGDALGEKLVLLRSYDPRAGGSVDVPDPYYGDDADFEACLAMVEAGCRGLVDDLVGRVAATRPAQPAQPAPSGGPNATSDSAS